MSYIKNYEVLKFNYQSGLKKLFDLYFFIPKERIQMTEYSPDNTVSTVSK